LKLQIGAMEQSYMLIIRRACYNRSVVAICLSARVSLAHVIYTVDPI